MNDERLYYLKSQIEKAEKPKTTITNIENICRKLENGSCEEIKFRYYDLNLTHPFSPDEERGGYKYETISAKELGIPEQEFRNWFTQSTFEVLSLLLKKLKKRL